MTQQTFWFGINLMKICVWVLKSLLNTLKDNHFLLTNDASLLLTVLIFKEKCKQVKWHFKNLYDLVGNFQGSAFILHGKKTKNEIRLCLTRTYETASKRGRKVKQTGNNESPKMGQVQLGNEPRSLDCRKTLAVTSLLKIYM